MGGEAQMVEQLWDCGRRARAWQLPHVHGGASGVAVSCSLASLWLQGWVPDASGASGALPLEL